MKYINNIDQLIGKKIYIFGTGLISDLFSKYTKGKNIHIYAYLESIVNEVRTFNGKPVMGLDSLEKSYPVVVATLSNYHYQINNNLSVLSNCDIMYISESLIIEMTNNILSEKEKKASIKIRLSEMFKMHDAEEKVFVTSEDRELLSDIVKYDSYKTIESIEENNKYKCIYLFHIDWSSNWKELIQKIFLISEKIVLSFRYNYIYYYDFNLIEYAKNSGYQLTNAKRYYKSKSQYNTEDVLLFFEKRKVETIQNDKLCNGCGLCEAVCVNSAISLIEDSNGYLKPYIDKLKCCNCKICLYSCPNYSSIENNNYLQNVFVYMANDTIRYKSSSGGVFGALSQNLIGDGWSICGVAWKDAINIQHIIVDKSQELYKLYKSKYMRSDIRTMYHEIKKIIKEKKVLFVGCPCQVNAIKRYIGDTPNLYTVDLICAEAPSSKLIASYINEKYDVSQIKQIEFRSKDHGWRPDAFKVIFKDGSEKLSHMEDLGQTAFHSRLMMDISCEFCQYSSLNRVGDITIGDAWGIPEYKSEYDDGKGTSVVIVNSAKGEVLYRYLHKNYKLFDEIPLRWLEKNRVNNSVKPHFGRDRFYTEYKMHGYIKSADQSLNNKYDVGIVGNWSYPNYGSELSYYALYNVIKDMGYSVLMIEWQENSEWKPYGCTQLFKVEPYSNWEIAYPAKTHADMEKYNELCEVFLQGSDQLLNPFLYKVFNGNFLLDWVYESKKKIGYALSFGHKNIKYPYNIQEEMKFNLSRFDSLSVREETAVNIMSDLFGISTDCVLDPVFLCNKKHYLKLIQKQQICGKYMFAYILDMNSKKLKIIEKIKNEMHLNYIIQGDAAKEKTSNIICIEEWLSQIYFSDFIITDSFHGMCFCLIFEKQFIVLNNNNRGSSRFETLLSKLGLAELLIENEDIDFKNMNRINYDSVNKKIDELRKNSFMWLDNSLRREKHTNTSDSIYTVLMNKISYLENELQKIKENM